MRTSLVVLRQDRDLSAPQPGIDVLGRLLPVADPDRHRALAGHHVATREQARTSGLEVVELHRPITFELDARHRAQERGVALLAERQDDRICGEGLEPSSRLRVAGLVELITSICSSGPSKAVIVRSQLMRTPSRSASSASSA